jgi:hypothetical protein
VPEPIAAFLRCRGGGQETFALQLLIQLVREDGKDPDAFLAGSSLLLDRRFVDAEGKTYLVLIMQAFNKLAGTSARTAILLTEDGRALDRVLVATDGHSASISAGFLEPAPVDGSQIAFGRDWVTWPEALKPYQVEQWERPARELFLAGKTNDPIVRLAIRGDRFEILTPEARR